MKPPQFSLADFAWTVGLLALASLGIAEFTRPTSPESVAGEMISLTLDEQAKTK